MSNTKTTNQATYDAIANKYEANYGDIPASIEYAEYIADHLKNTPNPAILDLGCGTGTLLRYFELKLSTATCTGVDFSQELLKIARQKLSRTTIICEDFAKFEPKEKYDVIIATFSLIHSNDRELELMIPKIHSWLNDGGYFYTSFILGEGEQMLPEPLDQNHKTYFNFHSEEYLKELFVKNGFTITKQKIAHSEDEYENEDDIYFILQR